MARSLRNVAQAGALVALAAAARPSDFDRDVRPIFEAHCVSCHGPQRQESLLRLDSRGQALRGGMSGEVVVPGHSSESLLIQHLTGEAKPRMPHEKPALDATLVARIAAWIDSGAAGGNDAPDEEAPLHWSYRKPQRPTPPRVRAAAWVRSPIDAFVLARLEPEGLRPSAEASRETLVRRVSLDLTGLPPTHEEISAFVNDASPGAYAAVVERLLASKHYGERWARPWLDLARYADTNGYEKDQRRSAWAYRDWVIAALNRDQSFRDFTIEQLAGDMLKDASVEQRIATGFHRNSQLNQEGGIDVEEQRFETLVDRVATTGTVWLGSTIACAQCHNHKFDPVSQKDYYRLLAFFDNGEYRVHGEGEKVVDRWIVEPELELATPEQARRRVALRREAEALRQEIEARDLDAEIAALEQAPAGPAAGFAPLLPSLEAALERARAIEVELDAMNVATALVLQERAGFERPSTPLRIKGSFTNPGERVLAGVPAVFGSLSDGEPANRLGLARWLVSDDNPLTARVAVNRLWETLFGRGLVASVEDFGTQGEAPSHPELLDWLAVEFMERGWSQKAILREIVSSATYRQDSAAGASLRERDPENRLLARGARYRLEAEMVRDVALAASGLLSLKLGGPSVYPPQPEGVWNVPYSQMKWETSVGEDRNRRSLYTFYRRSSPYPSLIGFDAPSREQCTVRRVRTNTPLQALTTLNDPVFVEAARALAQRMANEGGGELPARIALGYRLCTARSPSKPDLAALTALYSREAGRARGNPALADTAALTTVASVLLNLDATLTRE